MTNSPTPAQQGFYACKKCGATIDDSKPFIRCDDTACPEKSGKSLLDMLEEVSFPTPSPAPLSARLHSATYVDENTGEVRLHTSAEGICDEAADLIDTLTARVAELEASAKAFEDLAIEQQRRDHAERDAVQAALAAAEAREAALRGLARELFNALVRYEVGADSDAPREHREMMGRARAALSAGAQQAQGEPLVFTYTNYRSETGTRRAIPIRVYHGATEYHPEPQWLMEAHDVDKDAARVFAMRDMGQAQGGDIADPLDTPLPCDVNVPNMRFGKGIPLRVLVDAAARWKVIAAKVPLAEMEPALEQARASGLLPTETREDGNG
ncbi:hypothetical protein FBZ82_101146 [Azospirillum brasilense]|uniref:Uncharacterized protein n=1 Tax=Azospirillum brasilense TaxID=192 RepID=A0A560BNF5_AZOBR|nr:WYL domain-containing protein [Azospirillum brasilense]TWA74131.1 hypothetical protein FBZ82_101146 [Azospirillum brasilense]